MKKVIIALLSVFVIAVLYSCVKQNPTQPVATPTPNATQTVIALSFTPTATSTITQTCTSTPTPIQPIMVLTGFFGPADVAIDKSGNIFVTDIGNKRVVKYDSTGKQLSQITSYAGGVLFQSLIGVAVDSNSNLYVSDYVNGNVIKFDSNQNFVINKSNYQLYHPFVLLFSTIYHQYFHHF